MHALCWLFKCPFCRWMAKHFDRTLGTKGFASLPKLLQEEILAEIQRSFVRYAFFHMLARIRTWLFNVGLIFKMAGINFFTALCYLLCCISGTHIESQKELNHRITKNLWVTIHQHKIFVLYALPISFSENQTVKQ